MKPLLACVAGFVLASAAQAQSTFVTASGGMSKYQEDCSGTSSCDTTGNAFRLGAGYRFGGGIGLEGVLLNFGQIKAVSSGVSVRIKSQAAGLGGNFVLPMTRNLDLVTRLGVAEVKVKGNASGFGVTVNDSENTTSVYAGIGVNWSFTPNAYLEAAYDSTRGKLGGEAETISAFTVGIGMRF